VAYFASLNWEKDGEDDKKERKKKKKEKKEKKEKDKKKIKMEDLDNLQDILVKAKEETKSGDKVTKSTDKVKP